MVLYESGVDDDPSHEWDREFDLQVTPQQLSDIENYVAFRRDNPGTYSGRTRTLPNGRSDALGWADVARLPRGLLTGLLGLGWKEQQKAVKNW